MEYHDDIQPPSRGTPPSHNDPFAFHDSSSYGFDGVRTPNKGDDPLVDRAFGGLGETNCEGVKSRQQFGQENQLCGRQRSLTEEIRRDYNFISDDDSIRLLLSQSDSIEEEEFDAFVTGNEIATKQNTMRLHEGDGRPGQSESMNPSILRWTTTPLHASATTTTSTNAQQTATSSFDHPSQQPIVAVSYSAPSVASVSTNSTYTTSVLSSSTSSLSNRTHGSQGRNRHQRGPLSASSRNINGRILSETIDEETPGGLRSSLDAGMAAVRKWIRSRTSSSSTTTTTTRPTSSSNYNGSRNNSISNEHLEGFINNTSSPIRNADRPTSERRIFNFNTDYNNDIGGELEYTDSIDEFIANVPTPVYENELTPARAEHEVDPNRANRLSAGGGIARLGDSSMGTWGNNHPPRNPRQRALSEPDATSIRDLLFQRALTPQSGTFRRRRYRSVAGNVDISNDPTDDTGRQRRSVFGQASQFRVSRNGQESDRGRSLSNSRNPSTPQRLSSSAVEVLYSASQPAEDPVQTSQGEQSELADSHRTRRQTENQSNSGYDSQHFRSAVEIGNSSTENDTDGRNEARARWLRINRHFQVVITIVALVFSLLLFCILICWVVLASAFVASIDKPCDVPLKPYFWLVTAQLVLDIFRTDILRLFFRWDTNSSQRLPCRVITYNTAYLMYALAVLWLGISSVYTREDVTCRSTAGQFFRSSKAFVTLSIAAWAVIFLGYVLPFCFVATILTLNGYTPSSDANHNPSEGPFTVFPTPMGAPPGTMDQLLTARLDELPTDHSAECSVCMENFASSDTIVKTECNHYYHKQCLADWLSNARTCPVCRMDIPEALERRGEQEDDSTSDHEDGGDHGQHVDEQQNRGIGIGPVTRTFARQTDIHHEVMMMHHQIIRRRDLRNRTSSPNSSHGNTSGQLRNRSGSIEIRNRSAHSFNQHDSGMEEGRGR